MVEYWEFFKIAFGKILDFLHRVKNRSHKVLVVTEKVKTIIANNLLGSIFCYPILNLVDTLGSGLFIA